MRTPLLVSLLLVTGPATAAPPTVDSLLCKRTDTRDASFGGKTYLSLAVAPPKVASVTVDEDKHTVTVCTDASKKTCTSFKQDSYIGTVTANADGSLIVSGGEKALLVRDGKTGKTKLTVANKLDKDYGCGSGVWLGDTVLAYGDYCLEFDAKPFLFNGKTGKFIAAFGDGKLKTDPESVIDYAQLDGNSWAFTVYDHSADTSRGFVIDVSSGKVLATIESNAGRDAATITEGKQKRSIDKLPTCK